MGKVRFVHGSLRVQVQYSPTIHMETLNCYTNDIPLNMGIMGNVRSIDHGPYWVGLLMTILMSDKAFRIGKSVELIVAIRFSVSPNRVLWKQPPYSKHPLVLGHFLKSRWGFHGEHLLFRQRVDIIPKRKVGIGAEGNSFATKPTKGLSTGCSRARAPQVYQQSPSFTQSTGSCHIFPGWRQVIAKVATPAVCRPCVPMRVPLFLSFCKLVETWDETHIFGGSRFKRYRAK